MGRVDRSERDLEGPTPEDLAERAEGDKPATRAPKKVAWPPSWPPPPGARKWHRGEMDLWHVIIGRNGCGKTTRARALALAYARAGCRVLVCDPDGQFGSLVARSYPSVDAYRSELKKRAGTNMPTIVRFGDGAQVAEVIVFARELTCASNYVTPSVVVIDEGTAYGEATERKQANASLLRATGRRRNDAVGIIILQQQPTMLNYQSLANATQIDLFRIESKLQIEWVVRQLPDTVRLEDGRTMPARALVGAIPTLARGAYYGIDKRFH